MSLSRTAFCYVTDGNDDAEMRQWSLASLRRYCGDVSVFTATIRGAYPHPFVGEHVIDLLPAFRTVFGNTNPLRKCVGSSFPVIVFAKFVLPFVRELETYDRIFTLESDIEIIHDDFRSIVDIPFPDSADVGLVQRSGGTTSGSLARAYPDLSVTGLPYYSAGIVMMRGGRSSTTYVTRVREMLRVSEALHFRFPEEHAANALLAITRIPDRYHVIPFIEGAGGGGARDLSGALSLHYGGRRKAAIRDRWRRQYETGGTINLADITGTTKREDLS